MCPHRGLNELNHFILKQDMTNLHYSLELARSFGGQDIIIDRTIEFFGPTTKEKAAFAEIIDAVNKVENFLTRLFDTTSGIHLSDGDNEINFNVLIDAIESAQLSTIYLNVRMIRQELVVVAKKETLEEMKELYDFWELLELPIQQLLK